MILVIYAREGAREGESETSFLANVETMLRSLHEIESSMPAEYAMKFEPRILEVGGQSFERAQLSVIRTSVSLYLMVFQVSDSLKSEQKQLRNSQAIIHAIRPVLLHVVRDTRVHMTGAKLASSTPRRLAEISVEVAGKILLALLGLNSRGLLGR